MKKALTLFAVVLAVGMTLALDAEAKRLGGGRSSGMQRQNVTAPANPGAAGVPGAARQASPATAPTAAPGATAAAPKRSWMGPIAGLAAGLGLAALASHFGFGEGLANMMMIGLLVMAVLMAVTFVMRKRAMAQRPASAGAFSGMPGALRQDDPQGTFRTADTGSQQQPGGSLIGSRLGGGTGGATATGAQTGGIPADFDRAGFERNAKAQFMALQSANDARDLERLRDYLTPDMFELAKADIAERGEAAQDTQVFGLEAQVVDVSQDDSRYIVSVRFTGSMRDQHGAAPDHLDEIWHLVKPRARDGGWVIAGIQQGAAEPAARP